MLSSLHELIKQNNTEGLFLLRDCKKVYQRKNIVSKSLSGLKKLSPIINRWEVGIRMFWVVKNRQIN